MGNDFGEWSNHPPRDEARSLTRLPSPPRVRYRPLSPLQIWAMRHDGEIVVAAAVLAVALVYWIFS
jgi:hypothetical protein